MPRVASALSSKRSARRMGRIVISSSDDDAAAPDPKQPLPTNSSSSKPPAGRLLPTSVPSSKAAAKRPVPATTTSAISTAAERCQPVDSSSSSSMAAAERGHGKRNGPSAAASMQAGGSHRLASRDEVKRSAEAVIASVASEFPEYKRVLKSVAVETSHQMSSSAAKTVFDVLGASEAPAPRCIRLSLPIFTVRRHFDESLRDVVLHEAAHAIAGREAAHGPKWQSVCRRIGGTAALCHDLACGGERASYVFPSAPSAHQSTGAASRSARAVPVASKRKRSGSGAGRGSSARSAEAWRSASEKLISQLIQF